MDAEMIEKYFKRHRAVSYLLLGLSAFIIFLIIFLSRQLATQQALTTASQASELVGNNAVQYGQDGQQQEGNNIAQQASSCPIKGTYKGKFGTETEETDCFKINYCTHSLCGYKNVSYTCLRQQTSRGNQVRRTLTSCSADPIPQVASLCGCAVTPTPTVEPSPTPTPSTTITPSAPPIAPSVEPSEASGSCSGTFTGKKGDANYCLQSGGGDTSVRYTTVKCQKNGTSYEKDIQCGHIGLGASCCNLSSFTPEWASYICQCTSTRPTNP